MKHLCFQKHNPACKLSEANTILKKSRPWMFFRMAGQAIITYQSDLL